MRSETGAKTDASRLSLAANYTLGGLQVATGWDRQNDKGDYKGAEQQIAVLAHYSDGSVRDITRQVQYQSNEIAVAAFLDRRIGYMAIPQVIDGVLQRHDRGEPESLEHVKAIDAEARRVASGLLG